MKTLLALFLIITATALADAPFPGLKVIMTPEEYSRAGLDSLTPDQIGVIDAAIIRHYMSTLSAAPAANPQPEQQYTQEDLNAAVAKEKNASWLSHVGLPSFGADWKNQPSIKAVCTGWATGNSFKLDNGQVWEGVDPIRMELTGKDIEIQPRANGGFDLYVNGKNTAMRIIRVK